jgi:hypothetical protein
MTTTLTALLQKEAQAIAAAQQAIANGQSAKAQLTAHKTIQDDLLAVQAMEDAVSAAAAARIASAKTGAARLAVDYKPGADAVAAQLTAKGLTDGDLQTVVGAKLKAPLDPNKKYSDYVALKGTADTNVDTKASDLAKSRRKVVEERAKVGEREAAVNRYLESMEVRLARAKTLYVTAGQRAQAGDTAGGWWALDQAKALVQEINGANAGTLLTALSDACDAYATAVAAVLKDESDLAAAVASQTEAANNLKLASEQVLVALKAKVASP